MSSQMTGPATTWSPRSAGQSKHSQSAVLITSTPLTGLVVEGGPHVAGQRAPSLHTVCLVLTLFPFQGYPGPKGEMVRPQLSCLSSRGGDQLGPLGPQRSTARQTGPAGSAEVAAPQALPSHAQCMPPVLTPMKGGEVGRGASVLEKRGKGDPERVHAWPVSHGVRG